MTNAALLPRGIRNHNPGNIRPNPRWIWLGEGQPDVDPAMGAYCRFIAPRYGLRALIRDCRNKRRRGLNTLFKIKAAFAPAADGNDVAAYAGAVARMVSEELGIDLDVNDPLPPDTREFRIALAKAMTRVECGDPSRHGMPKWWYADEVYQTAAEMEENP
jgi:hypothetical protein